MPRRRASCAAPYETSAGSGVPNVGAPDCMEIDAAKGSKRLLENETVLILEDHGADRDHTVSRYLLTQTPCRVFVFDPASQRYERLIDVSMLDRIKTSTVFGYNIFATNSPTWAERIRSIPPSTRH